jgi:hypothetical protein
MEVPAVELPADADLDRIPTPMAVPALSEDDEPEAHQRPSLRAINANRLNR